VEPEAAPEPEPEEAATPEPEEAEAPPEPEEAEAPPEPEEAEPPTSNALVASANPQRTYAPDTGIIETGQRSTIGETGTDDPGAPNPEAVQPTEGEPGAPSETTSAPPLPSEAAQNPPEGLPDGATEAEAQETETASEITPDAAPEAIQERLAALPSPSVPSPSVTAPVTPSAIPVIPLDTSEVEPEDPQPTPDTSLENPKPEPVEPEETVDLAAAAVLSSPRPRLRQSRDAPEPPGLPDDPQSLREYLRDPNRVIESPLAAYRRDGVDPFLRGGGGNRGGNGFQSARGPGNSDVTNYAGEVLVHLNRSRKVAVSERGWARVFFRINPDGSLAWVDILDGSGSAEVDRGAKAQVRAAAPFPRPPNGATRQLTFVYQSR
ncbi:MAG: energy transducer TonB, partial [Pseudomonadota bacterium]